MYVCVCGIITIKRRTDCETPHGVYLPLLPESREINFLCFRSRLRIWSRQTGSAVRSRVSLLIFHTSRLNLVLKLTGSSHASRFHGGVHPTAIWSVPNLTRHATAYQWRSLTAQSLLAQGQLYSKVARVTAADCSQVDPWTNSSKPHVRYRQRQHRRHIYQSLHNCK